MTCDCSPDAGAMPRRKSGPMPTETFPFPVVDRTSNRCARPRKTMASLAAIALVGVMLSPPAHAQRGGRGWGGGGGGWHGGGWGGGWHGGGSGWRGGGWGWRGG